MTRDERERLARLEAHHEHLAQQVEVMDAKLDRLLRAAAMGQGAWWAMLKIGGVLTLAFGALAWAADRLHGRL